MNDPVASAQSPSTYLPPVHVAPRRSAEEVYAGVYQGNDSAASPLSNQLSNHATLTDQTSNQVASNGKSVGRQSTRTTTREPTRREPTRRTRVANKNALRSQSRRPNSVLNIPATTADDVHNGGPQPVQTVAAQEEVIDQFAELEKPIERISQTPAPLNTRPQMDRPTQPLTDESVLRENDPRNRNQSPLPGDSPQNYATPRESFPSLPVENTLRGGTEQVYPDAEPQFDDSQYNHERTNGPIGFGSSYQQDTAQDENPRGKSCDDFRQSLLSEKISEIALDMSPMLPEKGDLPARPTGDWTDQSGRLIATGTMVELSRGYVIVEGQNGLARIPFGKLSDSSMAMVAQAWLIPAECVVATGTYHGRCWTPQMSTWHAANLCHKPLYFEDIQLERYGHSHGPFLGPLHCSGHFFESLITWPYQTAINPPNECVYTLGYYRPGNCAPWLRDPHPISLRGAAREAGIITGAFFLF